MIIYTDIEQGSKEWFQVKAGKPSTSSFSKVMANGKAKGSMGVTAHKYAKRLAAERILGINLSQDDFVSNAMERGTEIEPLARKYFTETTFQKVQEIGGIENYGCFCSTDGLTKDAVIEIKSPLYPNHIEYLFDPSKLYDKDYKWQIQGEIWLSEKDHAIVISYHPAFGDKQLTYKVERDDVVIDKLKERLVQFNGLIDYYVKIIEEI